MDVSEYGGSPPGLGPRAEVLELLCRLLRLQRRILHEVGEDPEQAVLAKGLAQEIGSWGRKSNKKLLKMAIYSGFSHKKMMIFHSYVSLPEGNTSNWPQVK